VAKKSVSSSVIIWIENMEKKLPFTCPVCGRKKDYLLKELREGAVLTCPFCNLGLNLHGHMWEDVQKEIQKLKEKRGVKS
jgi:transcription elongation factor Elf1